MFTRLAALDSTSVQARKMKVFSAIFLIILIRTSAQNVSETTDIPSTGLYTTSYTAMQITPTLAGNPTVETATSSIEVSKPEKISPTLAGDRTIDLILTSIGRITTTPISTNEFTEVNSNQTPGVTPTSSVGTVYPSTTEPEDDFPGSLLNRSNLIALFVILNLAVLITIGCVCTCVCCGCCWCGPTKHQPSPV